jgi:signal transduction histidine kinase
MRSGGSARTVLTVKLGDGTVSSRDPTGAELRWPERLPLVMGLFVLGVVLVFAAQRHEFTDPNWGWAVLVAVALPWVLDMFDLPPVCGERRMGYPVLVSWTALVFGGWFVLGHWFPVQLDFYPFLIVLLIGEMSSTAGVRFGASLLAVGVGGLAFSTYVDHYGGNIIWVFGFTIGWLGGLAVRHQTRISTQLVDAQVQLSQQAKEEERRRLARDVHDLIAHSLAVTMLQLSGARLALQAGDTEEALAALADAEAAGRDAMTEIHRTVGLLGRDAPTGAEPPTPSAADLPELVEAFRHAGLDVTLGLDGDLSTVPLTPGLTAYRVVQESLANAVKHAPGATVELGVRVRPEEMEINVANLIVPGAPAGASGGNGLRGMAERAELLGGTVTAHNGDGMWKVDARIPWVEPE